MNFVQFHVGDWDSSTRLLSPLEKGVYIDLIFLYYSLERPLMRSECERISRAYTDEEKSALNYILGRFFMVDGDSYRHQRCDKEIAATRSKSAKAVASAKARWERKKANDEHEKVALSKDVDPCESDANASKTHMQDECGRNANAMLTDNRKPITSNKEKGKKEKPKTSIRRKPKTAWPDFKIIPDDWKLIAEQTAPDLDPDKVFEEFKNYAISQDARYVDWTAAFRNSVGSMPDWKRKSMSRTKGVPQEDFYQPAADAQDNGWGF